MADRSESPAHPGTPTPRRLPAPLVALAFLYVALFLGAALLSPFVDVPVVDWEQTGLLVVAAVLLVAAIAVIVVALRRPPAR